MLNRQTKCLRYFIFPNTQCRTEPKDGPTCLVVFSIEITTGEDQRIPRSSSECARKHGISVKVVDYFWGKTRDFVEDLRTILKNRDISEKKNKNPLFKS